MIKFSEMNLISPLLENLKTLGYEIPTPVQVQAIPLILEGHDLIGMAQTGTGKTAAFSLPILQTLLNDPRRVNKGEPRVLVLAPTRELVSQIHLSIEGYAQNTELKSMAIYGGVGEAPQVQGLKKGIDILVATPGRLLDLMRKGFIRLDKVEMFVMDEADRMLDLGFMEEIESIVLNLPVKKQSMFFSATMPASINRLVRSLLKNPKRVEIAPSVVTVDKIKQSVIHCSKTDKFQLLKKILSEEKTDSVLVFTGTKQIADNVVDYLHHYRIPCSALHSGKSQDVRELALSNFKNSKIKTLIATDIAARGIDVEDVSHVINFDLPTEMDSYVHRVGRTARAGKSGIAISFCESTEKTILERIEQHINKKLPQTTFKGTQETKVVISKMGRTERKVTPPTPGKSQEKSAYRDHSKRQKPAAEGEKKRVHPGFKNKKR